MKLFSLIKSAKRSAARHNRSLVRTKKPSLLERSDFYEGLEKRQLLAAFSNAGGVVTLDLNVTNQLVTVSANSTAYTFTLSGGATNLWNGTSGGGYLALGANLTVNSTALANVSMFNIGDSANNTGVTFGNSAANPYNDSFNITLNNTSSAVLFSGNSTFSGNNSLSILADSRVELPTGACLTMNNGSLSMDINTQATPQVLNYSGLMVNGATIRTLGNGSTSIVARGGIGAAASYLNKGVAVVNGGQILGGTTGTMNITGYGYNGLDGGVQGQGVIVYNASGLANSVISSIGANVSVTGYGANNTNATIPSVNSCMINTGVVVGQGVNGAGTAAGTITSGGNGTVTVTGYGGSLANQTSAQSHYAIGVYINGPNATITSGGAGLVTVTGTGGGAQANTSCGMGVFLNCSTISSGANGSVVVNGTGCTTAASQFNIGVYLTGTSRIVSGPGSGSTTVTGTGGGVANSTLASSGHGVYLNINGGNGTISALGTGNVTVTGYGGPGAGSASTGVQITAPFGGGIASITSNGGAVSVTGYGGGSGNSGSNHGVLATTNSMISAGGSASVSVVGYGGNNNGTGSTNYGVFVSDSTGKITSSGGNVLVQGYGGGGTANSPVASASASNYGVYVSSGGYIQPGGAGTLTVYGEGGGRSPGATGSNNWGVGVSGANTLAANTAAFSFISSSGGAVNITGKGGGGAAGAGGTTGTNYGVVVSGGGLITSGGNAELTVNGTGGGYGNGTTSNNYGVYACTTANVTSNGQVVLSTIKPGGEGNLVINGTGGGSAGTGATNYGVVVGGGAIITASGLTSSVTINGQGGSSSGQQNYGVTVAGVSTVGVYNSTISSGGGNVTVIGCGPLSTAGSNQHGIMLGTSGTITSGGNGSVTVTGRAGTGDVGTTGNGHVGVQVSGGLISSGGSGPVLVTGYGGGNGARTNNYGVQVISLGVITGGANAPVTVVGYGGNANGTGGSNYGACVTGAGSKITSSNGPVSITGYGGQTNTTISSTSGNNYGFYMELGGEVSSTGTAPITVTGNGGGLGTGTTNLNVGVILVNLSPTNTSPRITSDGGQITVTGTGGGTNGSGSQNYGACISQGGQVYATGSGTDTSVTGTGGGGGASATNYGIFLGGNATVSNNTITANGGDILLTGIEGNGSGSRGIFGCTTLPSVIGNATTPGNVTLVTNSAVLAITAGSAINATNLLIVPRTAGVSVGLGCTTDAKGGPLNLSNTELGTLSAGNIQLGDSSTGNFTVSSVNVAIPTASNLTLVSNSTASTGISSTGTITMGAGKVLNVSALPSVNTLINGTTAQTQYNQLNVVGNLSLAGKALNLSGPYISTGGDVFTIANATSLTGTFTGLADGSTTTLNGRTLLVNYTPTTVTLTDPAPKVTSQPANSTVTAGNQASFTAAATGIPDPGVQWQVSINLGSTWADIPGATSLTYSFTTAAGDNTKQYHAVFTNTYGNATTSAATLTVQTAPSITTQPTDQTVNDGQTATFTAAATGNPTPTVQWQVNSGSGWANVTDGSGGTTNSYTTAALTSAQNGYQYRAVYTNGIGSDATTSAATLTVNTSTPPSISTQPTNQSANAGGTATFSAAATGSPTPTVQWQVNSGSGWANVTDGTGGTTDSYTTAALTTAQNGYQYRAVYTNGVGSDATTNAATLTVNAATSAPVITGQPVSIGVEAGQTASFTATATGNPTPSVKWQSSPDGSTGWADITGANSGTLSFTATVGDNGKYYRAVFSNGVNPDATTNAAKLSIGVAPAIITASEMTIPVGLTSGMSVIATGSPAPTYSIIQGSLPAGVTLDTTTGLLSGTPAAGTAGSWPIRIKADNGIGNGATQDFSLKVTATITSFTVSKGQAQRSYLRYLDLGMDSNASALALLNNPSRVRLTKADLNGVGSTPVSLTGFLSVPSGQSTLAVDFGTIGLGNSRNATTADGYYTLGVDLDGNGSFETNLFFFRLFGDTNGDREVTAADQSAVLAGCTQPYNANLDLNGDGVVNTSDYQYVKKSVGRKLKSTLIVTA